MPGGHDCGRDPFVCALASHIQSSDADSDPRQGGHADRILPKVDSQRTGKASPGSWPTPVGVDAGVAVFQAPNDANAVTVSGNANLNLNGGVLYDSDVLSMGIHLREPSPLVVA
jgi:hypothetical protein